MGSVGALKSHQPLPIGEPVLNLLCPACDDESFKVSIHDNRIGLFCNACETEFCIPVEKFDHSTQWAGVWTYINMSKEKPGHWIEARALLGEATKKAAE